MVLLELDRLLAGSRKTTDRSSPKSGGLQFTVHAVGLLIVFNFLCYTHKVIVPI